MFPAAMQDVTPPAKAQSGTYTITGTATIDYDNVMFDDSPMLIYSTDVFTVYPVLDIEIRANDNVFSKTITGTSLIPVGFVEDKPSGEYEILPEYTIEVTGNPGQVVAEFRRYRLVFVPSVDGQLFYNDGVVMFGTIFDELPNTVIGYVINQSGSHFIPDDIGFSLYREITLPGYTTYLPLVIK